MTHKRTLWARAQQIFKRSITPRLGAAGFKKQGIVYVREIGRVLHVLNHESDDLSTADKISFTLNCGVHIRGVDTVRYSREMDRIEACGCLMSVRPGFLTPNGNDWWEISSSDAPDIDATIAQAIESLINNTVLPFFERFPNERAIADFLAQPRKPEDRRIFPFVESSGLVYAGIIWSQLGEYEKCRAAMAQAITFAGTKRLEAKNAIFAKNFVCDGQPKMVTPQHVERTYKTERVGSDT